MRPPTGPDAAGGTGWPHRRSDRLPPRSTAVLGREHHYEGGLPGRGRQHASGRRRREGAAAPRDPARCHPPPRWRPGWCGPRCRNASAGAGRLRQAASTSATMAPPSGRRRGGRQVSAPDPPARRGGRWRRPGPRLRGRAERRCSGRACRRPASRSRGCRRGARLRRRKRPTRRERHRCSCPRARAPPRPPG